MEKMKFYQKIIKNNLVYNSKISAKNNEAK